jgi:hypothetical protein
MGILPSMWRTLQYPHLLESICLAWYSEHGISILKNPFISWFMILSKNDVGIAFLLGFVKAM